MSKLPSLSFHKQSKNYFVKIHGKQHYLGKDITKAQIAYSRLITQNYSMGEVPESLRKYSNFTVRELVIDFLEKIHLLYEKSRSFSDFKQAGRILVDLYGNQESNVFSVRHFESIKDKMIQKGWSLKTVNARIGIIKRIFKYAQKNEIISAEQYFKLKLVEKFKLSDYACPPPKEIDAVSDEIVNKTLPFFPKIIADMIIIQKMTGMRSGEICPLRFSDIDKSPNEWNVWSYRPKHHKTESKGKKRVVFFNRTCQQILRKYMTEDNIDTDDYIFSPIKSMKMHREELRRARKSKVQPSQIDRSVKNPVRRPFAHYTSDSYARAIRRGCRAAVKAGVINESEVWHSHQLRHWAGSEARRVKGLDAAQALLGHSHASTTEIYAKISESLAAETASIIG